MLIGHFAAGFAGKKFSPVTPLPLLFVGCQLLDLVWPVAVLLGLEFVSVDHSLPTYNHLNLIHAPYSHSLEWALIWSVLFGLIVARWLKSKRAGIVSASVVFSHWILDLITHIPDLPILLLDTKVGLGLWKSAHLTFILEAALFFTAVALYYQVAKPKGKSYIHFVALVFTMFILGILFTYGPQQAETDSSMEVAGSSVLLWIPVWWAWIIEKKS